MKALKLLCIMACWFALWGSIIALVAVPNWGEKEPAVITTKESRRV